MSVRKWYNEKSKQHLPVVLEVGCETVRKITIDVSEGLINQQKYMHADIQNVRFPSGIFNKVRAIGSLECVDLEKVIRKVAMFLDVNGVFEFTAQRDAWWIRFYRKHIRKKHPKDKHFTTKQYTKRRLEMLLNRYGLKIIECKLISKRTIYYVRANKKHNTCCMRRVKKKQS